MTTYNPYGDTVFGLTYHLRNGLTLVQVDRSLYVRSDGAEFSDLWVADGR